MSLNIVPAALFVLLLLVAVTPAFAKPWKLDGSIVIEPDTVPADSRADITFTYTAGPHGLQPGDGIAIIPGDDMDRWDLRWLSTNWGPVSAWLDPDGSLKVSASSNSPEAQFDIQTTPRKERPPVEYAHNPYSYIRAVREGHRNRLLVTLKKGRIAPGEKVYIRWNQANTPTRALSYVFPVAETFNLPALDRDFPFKNGHPEEHPIIHVIGKPAAQFHVVIPARVESGREFRIKAAAVDQFGNLDPHFTGKLEIRSSEGDTRTVTLKESDKGHLVVTGNPFHGTGFHTVTITCGEIKGTSNPCKVLNEAEAKEGWQIFYGDMHTHSLDCDAVPLLSESWEYGRDAALLDFAAMSCHSEYLTNAETWNVYRNSSKKYHKSGEYVTFCGYEWSGGGHVNCYFSDPDKAVLISRRNLFEDEWQGARVPADDPPFRIFAQGLPAFFELLEKYREDCFAIMHHHSKLGENVRDDLQTVFEMHTSPLQDFDALLQGTLALGKRAGVFSGGDTHRAYIGALSPIYDPAGTTLKFAGGMGAVWARKLERKDIETAIRQRRTYGTSGPRIYMDFNLNGESMGQVVSGKGTRKIKLDVCGTAPLKKLEILRFANGEWTSIWSKSDFGTDVSLACEYEDTETTGKAIYYLRLRQSDGHMAWSSPIWVE